MSALFNMVRPQQVSALSSFVPLFTISFLNYLTKVMYIMWFNSFIRYYFTTDDGKHIKSTLVFLCDENCHSTVLSLPFLLNVFPYVLLLTNTLVVAEGYFSTATLMMQLERYWFLFIFRILRCEQDFFFFCHQQIPFQLDKPVYHQITEQSISLNQISDWEPTLSQLYLISSQLYKLMDGWWRLIIHFVECGCPYRVKFPQLFSCSYSFFFSWVESFNWILHCTSFPSISTSFKINLWANDYGFWE